MDPNRKTDRILAEWDAVADTARRPVTAPRRRGFAGFGSAAGLAGAGLLAAALVVAVGWLGGRIAPGVGTDPTGAPSPAVVTSGAPVASTAPAASTTAVASAPPVASAEPVASGSTAAAEETCDSDHAAARVTAWEGAAGSRIADVTVSNTATSPCLLAGAPVPELVDATGRTLVRGTAAARSAAPVRLEPGASVTTLVAVSNFCGTPPTPPVTIAFDLGGGNRLVAVPLSPTDATVPPCNGPGMPGQIQMQEWSR